MRYRALVGTLRLRTALHVGSGQGDDLTDALCQTTSDGRWVIPGTALAGVLRSAAVRLAPRIASEHGQATVCRGLAGTAPTPAEAALPCRCLVCSLFGYRYLGTGETEENRPRGSRLVISDAVAQPSPGHARIRDGVGIGRAHAAAARNAAAKFDVEVVPAGTCFSFRIEFPLHEDGGPLQEEQDRLLAAALAEWQAGRETLGGRSGRGLGAFELECLQSADRDLDTHDGLLDYLQADEPWHEPGKPLGGGACGTRWLDAHLQAARSKRHTPAEPVAGAARRFLVVTADLTAAGSLVVNDPAAAGVSGFEFAPLLEQLQAGAKPVLPGSSLRGGLRSQAERIARTVASQCVQDARPDDSPAAEFGRRCPACDPLQGDPAKPLASCESLLRKKRQKNAVFDETRIDGTAHFCLACRLFGSVWRGSRLRVEDAPWSGGEFEVKAQDFLAIDRFTGGGRDGAKFDALSAWKPRFRLRLQLDNPDPWELGWLALVLRDVRDGLVPVGFGSSKGFGRVTLKKFSAELGTVTDEDFPPAGDPSAGNDRLRSLPQTDSGLYRITSLDEAAWLDVAEPWVAAFHEQIEEFQRGDPALRAATDSYFSDRGGTSLSLPLLYPLNPMGIKS
jgi:CRISPR/Cas system CSM-associated protein Csm3 (group 7 of RAMP superfamily)